MRGTYRRLALAAGAGLLATLPLGAAGEKIDYEAINKIKAAGHAAAELEGHGDLELADRCPRPAPERLAEHPESGRVGGRRR